MRKIIRFLFLPLPTFLPVSVRISGQHIPPVSSAQRRFPRIRSGQTVSAGEILGVLEDLEDQKFSNLKFVELDACSGGCVGGVLTVENPYVAEVKLKRLRRYMPVARSHMDGEHAEDCMAWTKEVDYEPVFSLGHNMMESFARLNQAERLLKKLPGLDCGSCGAPTCKALAEDIVRGEAREEDCVYYLRESLHKLSSEVSHLADDMAAGEKDGRETLRLLKEYIQKISDDMAKLDEEKR